MQAFRPSTSTSTTSNQESLQIGDNAPDFTLQDAGDQEYSLERMRGTTVFLIMGNRKIRNEDDKWAEAFQKDYRGNDQVRAYIVANMRSVPRFLPKRFIKAQVVKNEPPATLLLDWNGEIHEAYHTQKQKPNLYLIDPDGTIAFHADANFNDTIYQELKVVIERQ